VEEVWTGTTFSVASHMLSEGMHDEAFKTAEGVYNVVWKDRGYFFRTPEAYDARGFYRASMYMRPGAIWSMELPLAAVAGAQHGPANPEASPGSAVESFH
jgi:non-lysosomal glucosylceramidase